MTPAPHSQRCETCENWKQRFYGSWPKCPMHYRPASVLEREYHEFIDHCGCASHTSAESPTREDLIAFARWTQTFWKNGIEIMRKNGLVIKSDEPMEKLAFTFYTDLCEIDREARHLFQEGPGDENYKHETDIQCQTITAYPKPYEERIRESALKDALPQSLSEHYAALSAETGKPVSELVARDLEEYQEYRRWLENERERL